MDLYANVTEYLIGGLKPSTSYTVSVLAYTVGDGPRSIHLTGTTNSETICKFKNYIMNLSRCWLKLINKLNPTFCR